MGGLRGPNRGNQRHTLDTLDTYNAINVANSKTIPDMSIKESTFFQSDVSFGQECTSELVAEYCKEKSVKRTIFKRRIS